MPEIGYFFSKLIGSATRMALGVLAVAGLTFVTYLPIGSVLFLLHGRHYSHYWVIATVSLVVYTILVVIFVRACRRRPYQRRPPRRGSERRDGIS